MKFESGPATSGPSSSLGIMRFFDADEGGPKVRPEIIVGIAIAFALIVLVLHLFKF